MLRRSILELSSRRRILRTQRVPLIISSRKELSTAPQLNSSNKPGSKDKLPESKGNLSTIVVGTTVIAGAALLAYQNGYLNQYINKENEKHKSIDLPNFNDDKNTFKDAQHLVEPILSSHSGEEPKTVVDQGFQNVQKDKDLPWPGTLSERTVENEPHLQEKDDLAPEGGTIPVEKDSAESFKKSIESDIQSSSSPISSERSVHRESPESGDTITMEKDSAESLKENIDSNIQSSSPPISSYISIQSESPESKTIKEPKEVQAASISTQVSVTPQQGEDTRKPPQKTMPHQHIISEDKSKDALGKGAEAPASLLDTYHLRDDTDEAATTKATEDYVNAIEELSNVYLSKDGKVVFDFLQAIHTAEKRQAELDAGMFAKEKRELKERYEKELRDSRARELMNLEEAAILEKELKRERTKTAAAIKSLQEKMEEKLKLELEQKESEADLKLKQAQELGKAELAAAITREKAAQIEKMAEANLHINALCMAFYARSEEARKNYFAHKLALGALALEDALSKGSPIVKEIDALYTCLDGIEKDAILDLVLSSIPEEARYHGTETPLQLRQKFDILKGTLRHFSLIPPGGGGILTHALAHVAAWLKVKEAGESGDGIESVISRVESYLRDGKLAEAADALEQGVQGSQAEQVVIDWVRRARNRAITEQGLTFLQSYATCLSLT